MKTKLMAVVAAAAAAGALAVVGAGAASAAPAAPAATPSSCGNGQIVKKAAEGSTIDDDIATLITAGPLDLSSGAEAYC